MAKTHIVIIEDHLLVRDMFARIAREHLGLVVAAECGGIAEGVIACRRERPELAILDWTLPDGCGAEVMKRVGPELPNTRWLCVSAFEQEEVVSAAVDLGFHGFVMKKSDFATLRTAIGAVLGGEEYFCPVSARLLAQAMRSRRRAPTVVLTPREQAVLRGIALGRNPKEIAAEHGLELKTVHNHLGHVKDKLGIREPAGLVRYAIQTRLIAPP